MKMKHYTTTLATLILLLTGWNTAFSQSSGCSSLQFTYTTTEARCMATGTITVQATGGSGNYNYKLIGTTTTPFTSSNVIAGLQAGTYKVVVKDVATGCEAEQENAVVAGSYSDPRFQLLKTDVSCAGNDGSIRLESQQGGRGPFTYTIVAPSAAGIGTTNATGTFTGLIGGDYTIQLTDSCGGVQTRPVSIVPYSWAFTSFSVTKVGCDSADAVIDLHDNRTGINTMGTAFNGFVYGVTKTAGDTTWFPTRAFRFYLGKARAAVLVVRGGCSVLRSAFWALPAGSKPTAAGPVTVSDKTCTGYTAAVTGQQNLTNPQYCLYNISDELVGCNTTGLFSNIPYGLYCIEVRDVCYDTTFQRCFSIARPKPQVDAAVDTSNKACSGFTARVIGQQNLTNPQYCLYNAANTQIACNTTGVFTNVGYGSYCIRIADGCVDTTISRCFKVSRPMPVLTSLITSNRTCNTFTLTATGDVNLTNGQYCLYDASGNAVTCNATGVFEGLAHGTYCITGITSCGDTTARLCVTSGAPPPNFGAVVKSNLTCSTFRAAITGQSNLTNPQYCLYDSTGSTLIRCNTTGVFDSIPYGGYRIRITDGCANATQFLNFSEKRALPVVASQIQMSNQNCSTFTATVNGQNLFNPQYCLYDASDNLIRCNTTGVFNAIAYGSYCVRVKDGCYDTTIRVCANLQPTKTIAAYSYKTCSLGTTFAAVLFNTGAPPYALNVYNPNGTVAFTQNGSYYNAAMYLPALPAGQQYKFVGRDGCGRMDSTYFTPDVLQVSKSVLTNGKCPGSRWASGSGDITVTSSSNQYPVIPTIIKKDAASVNIVYTTSSGTSFTFQDMEPATYVVRYTVQTCNVSVYDTITINPYSYPNLAKSAVYQCNDKSFSVSGSVTGGIAPFQYEIIGSYPESPRITAPAQSNPVFSINNGTAYSMVRLRATDACSNATLNDVGVLPLQNIAVKASSGCYNDNITLSVDSVANASYQWYKKTSNTDSTLVGTRVTYNILSFNPSDMGQYTCRMSVNGGCLTRTANIQLTGNCGYSVLPNKTSLAGKNRPTGNELSWGAENETDVKEYVVERKTAGENQYRTIGTVAARALVNKTPYSFLDGSAPQGATTYRVKIVNLDGSTEYTNAVKLTNAGKATVNIYPNPATSVLHIALKGSSANSYMLELVNLTGQVVFSKKSTGTTHTAINFYRSPNIKAGMYLLKVTDTTTGSAEAFKVRFE